MEQLLGRMRGERPGDYPPDESRASGTSPDSELGDGRAIRPGHPEGRSDSTPETRKTRRVHDVNEVRAGVGPLREIANFSARVAVATHSSRKLRRSVTTTLPLAMVSFVLA